VCAGEHYVENYCWIPVTPEFQHGCHRFCDKNDSCPGAVRKLQQQKEYESKHVLNFLTWSIFTSGQHSIWWIPCHKTSRRHSGHSKATSKCCNPKPIMASPLHIFSQWLHNETGLFKCHSKHTLYIPHFSPMFGLSRSHLLLTVLPAWP